MDHTGEMEVRRLRVLLDSTRNDMWAGFAVVIFLLVLLVSNSFQTLQQR
jgi:hypothetical protein